MRPQAVLDQVEHVLVLLIAVRVGGPADCDDLIPELLGIVFIPHAVRHKLGKLRVVDALVALEERLREVHERVGQHGAGVLDPPPFVPHKEDLLARRKAEHVIAHCLQEVVAQLGLLEAGAPYQPKRMLADFEVPFWVGPAGVVTQRAPIVVGRLLGLGPRLIEAVRLQAAARPQLARRTLPRKRQAVGRALAAAGG